ncbi:MAG: division plane positioning ATPase MipZ, partial [Rickettsiales bacterium]|nr:division plane positioning ATPase MipZ [Rickettsiales bacterium]
TPQLFADELGAKEDMDDLDAEINALKENFDIIIIDTPGTYNHLSNAGHKNADILITPVNDSLVDLDVIAKVDLEKSIFDKSHYTLNVEKLNGIIDNPEIGHQMKKNFQWVVLRNRVSHIDANNKKEVDKMLRHLSERIGFKYLPGIGERVIYREMFLKGLTISDVVREKSLYQTLTISHIAAKNELAAVVNAIGIPIPKAMAKIA